MAPKTAVKRKAVGRESTDSRLSLFFLASVDVWAATAGSEPAPSSTASRPPAVERERSDEGKRCY
jgi:hypothetical protein